MTTRKELKEQVKLLELLEQLEALQSAPMTMEIVAYSSRKAFRVSGAYTGKPTVDSSLNDIARQHATAMIKEQIYLVKARITIEMEDK